uniref:LITAF domain-containing protein n=1 Tax=Salarias fasciatus TaxID=181472 RepID=A0A672F837_SALFA
MKLCFALSLISGGIQSEPFMLVLVMCFVPLLGVQFAPAQTAPVTVVAPDLLQVLPGRTVCQQCQQTVLTDTEYTPGCITWLLCILLASIGCFFCFWVPFFHYGCKDVEHRCPSCNNVIHVHKRCTGYSRPRYASQA